MKSNYKRLGGYIRQVDVRNRDLAVNKLLGLSISKQFIPSIANTTGTDMSTYKIVQPRQFGYVPVTSRNGDKITIALYEGESPCIISQAYIVFEVIDETELLPEYLMMWFRRPEFDRYARFKSHGSAREVFEWSEMCEVLLPVPPIEEQQKVVAEYQAIERRIENNRRLIVTLEETAQSIYRKMFADDIDTENLPEGWRMGIIGEFGAVVTGKTPSSNCPEDFGNAIDFITPSEFSGEDMFCAKAKRGLSLDGISKLQSKLIPKYSIAVTCIGSDMGKVRICSKECISNQQINSIIMSDKNKMPFLFFTLRNMKDYFQRIALGSSTMPMLSKSEFEKINVLVPDEESVVSFGEQALPIIKYIFGFETEIQILRQIQSHLLLQISRI